MSFFTPTPKYDYRPPAGYEGQADAIQNQLQYFDPWAYQPKPTRTQKIYGQSLDQFFGNREKGLLAGDPSKNILTSAPLAQLAANYSRIGNNMMSRNIATGDAGLANSGLLKGQAEEANREAQQQHARDATGVVAGAQNQALGGFEQAVSNRRSFGLQAAGIKANTLGMANPKNFVLPPTGYTGGGGAGLIGSVGGFILGGPAGAELGGQIGNTIGGNSMASRAPLGQMGGGGFMQNGGQQGGEEQQGFGGLLGNRWQKGKRWGGLFGEGGPFRGQSMGSRAGIGYGGFGENAWSL